MSSFINETFSFIPASSPFLSSGTYTVPNGFFAIATVYFLSTNSSTSFRAISLNGTVILQDNQKRNSAGGSTGDTCIVYNATNVASSYVGTPYENKLSAIEENYSTGNGVAINVQSPNKLTLYLKAGDQLTGAGTYLINLFVNSNNTGYGLKRFNYCPSQTVVASGAYTIPAGKHARVLHYFIHQTYTPNAMGDYPSVNTLTINGAVVEYINNKTAWEYYSYYDEKAAQQVTYDYRNKNRGTPFFPPKPVEHFLKAGDVVSGSGNWRAIVSLYDVIT